LAVAQQLWAGDTGSEVTISLSGSTAMRNFTVSSPFSFVTPGTQISIGGTLYPADPNYWNTPSNTSYQIAPGSFPFGTGTNKASDAVRYEWHEQGSVEGILEMANDQIAPIGSVTASNRNASGGNPLWVNHNTFTAPTTTNGFVVGQFYPGSGTSGTTNFELSGRNPNGGQNAVQMAISDVTTRQGFSTAGASGAFNKRPGEAGYGKGNAALSLGATTSGIGQGNVRHELVDATLLNMPAATINPRTGAAFGSGAWNTAGVDNLDNETVAITATLFVANPGSGLEKLNRNDAQFLQAAGRLANGADFNVSTRDVNSGTLNVAATNVGLDSSFAVGENDNGSGTTAETNIGGPLKFSNKTSGGSLLRPTVQNSRMALGHLSISDSIGSTKNSVSRPIRALAYRDDDNDVADNSNNAYRPVIPTGDARDTYTDPSSGAFVAPSANSIVDGSYVIYQNETYVTAKKPGAAFAADTPAQWAARKVGATGIQGDNANNDVRNLRNNILTAVASFPPAGTNLANSVSPADGMLATSFILPQIMSVTKASDGINQSVANGSQNTSLKDAFLLPANGYTGAFTPDAPTTVTAGTGGTYGNFAATSAAGINITTSNYLFGNFNQNGIRDIAAVKAAQVAQAALAANPAGVDMFAGSNNAKISGVAAMPGQDGTAGATKGDLIVMGDYNSDGKFDGKDLYQLAHGAALANSNTGSGANGITLAGGETFGAAIRRSVLLKNAALDYMHANATAQQKLDATANVTNDPTGANAFNKFDVNRDGLINRFDAKVVDQFVGKDYRNLNDQLGAVITDAGGTRMISLVDAELNDNGVITHIGAATSDFKSIRDAVAGQLLNGDADFSGVVNIDDFNALAANYNGTGKKWSQGDFANYDGVVNIDDFNALAANYNMSVPGPIPSAADWQGLASAISANPVPEPASLGVIGLGATALLARRRRRPHAS
jgi:hypothetical protein